MASNPVSVGPSGVQFTPDTENVPLSGVNEGIQMGMKLALAQEQITKRKVEVEQQKAQLQFQAGTKALDAFDGVLKSSGKAVDIYFNEFARLMGMTGRAVDPALKDVIMSDKQTWQRLQAEMRANPELVASPEFQAQISLLTGNATEANGVVQNMFNQFETDRRAKLAAAAQSGRQEFQAEQQKQRDAAQRSFQRAENEKNRASREGIAEDRIDMSKDRLDQTVHQRNLQAIKKDTQLNERFRQYGNLDNALATIVNADTLTPQQIDEFQQAVRSNLGIKGTGGVEERGKTYFNNLGLTVDRWAQFLTGDPVNIAKDTKLVQHLKDLARVEQENIRGLSKKRLRAMGAGNRSVYDRRPDLESDFFEAAQAVQDQFQSTATAGGKAAAKPQPSAGTQVQNKVLKPATAALIQGAKASGKSFEELKAMFERKGFTLSPEDLK